MSGKRAGAFMYVSKRGEEEGTAGIPGGRVDTGCQAGRTDECPACEGALRSVGKSSKRTGRLPEGGAGNPGSRRPCRQDTQCLWDTVSLAAVWGRFKADGKCAGDDKKTAGYIARPAEKGRGSGKDGESAEREIWPCTGGIQQAVGPGGKGTDPFYRDRNRTDRDGKESI